MNFLPAPSKKLLGILLVLVAVPLTVFIAQKQQELRQHAAGEQVALYFTKQGSTTPIADSTLPIQSSGIIDLYLDAKSIPISGFDIILKTSGQEVTFTQLTEGAGAKKFTSEIFNVITDSGHTLRFSKVTTDSKSAITGALLIGSISLQTGTNTEQGTIDFAKSLITSVTFNTALSVGKSPLHYFVSSLTPSLTNIPDSPTSVPPTEIPTATPSLTPSPTLAPGKVAVFLTEEGKSAPLTTLTTSSINPVSLDLYLNAGETNLNGFDITIKTTGPLLFNQISDGTDGKRFNTSLFNSVSGDKHTLRFSKVNSDTNLVIKNILYVGRISFTASAGGTGSLDFSKTIITSPSSATGLPTTATKVDYTLSGIIDNPTPTEFPPTPVPPPGSTLLALSLTLSGLGVDIPASPANKSPIHPEKEVKVEVFNNTNQLVTEKSGTIIYASQSGKFKGIVNLGTAIPAGNYHIKVSVPKYLKKLIPVIQTIVPATTNQVADTTLIVGDINSDNLLNILDYNLYVQCFNQKSGTASCAPQREAADLNDNGQNDSPFDLSDYRLLFASFATQKGD